LPDPTVYASSRGKLAFRSFKLVEPLPSAPIAGCGEPLLVLPSLQSFF
jgi:hypothetical protein